MNYRTLGRTGISVSEIGIGCEHLQGKDYAAVKFAIDEAFEQGINIFDVFMSEPMVRTNIGNALVGKREKVIIQGHIGVIWEAGQYTLSRDMRKCKTALNDLLQRLQTTYIDIGMVHFVDTAEDFETVFYGGMMDYLVELKELGIVKAIGIASHEPNISIRAVKTGLVDVLMFSINPAYDLMPSDTPVEDMMAGEKIADAIKNQIDPLRMELYQTCERKGTAITVMKTYMAGRLLNAEQSPFGWALTPSQCIHYALTRPAVASVLIGSTTPDEILQAVAYESATDQEKDFSDVFKQKLSGAKQCVYCNHCLPCPVFIDIAKVNKCLDLALAVSDVPDTVFFHYKALSKHAGECVHCGDCEARCPFGVPIRERMVSAVGTFGS